MAQQCFLHFLSVIFAGVTKTFGFDLIAYFVKQGFFFMIDSLFRWCAKSLEASGCASDAVACGEGVTIHLFPLSCQAIVKCVKLFVVPLGLITFRLWRGHHPIGLLSDDH